MEIFDARILNKSQDLHSEINSNLQKLCITENIMTRVGANSVTDINRDGQKEESSLGELNKTIVLPVMQHCMEFKLQHQGNKLASIDNHCDFVAIELAAKEIANEVSKSGLELDANNDCISSATSETKSNSRVEFKISEDSTQYFNEEHNGNVETSKQRPTIDAIDKLLLFSSIPTNAMHKLNENQGKNDKFVQKYMPDNISITDANASKELKLVKTMIHRLEEELKKRKEEHVAEMEKQKNVFQERINKLQIVVEEYEKSISRLLMEKEKGRSNLEQGKVKLQEELQVTNCHLNNAEAALNDVHMKHERLKAVVSAYKSNETVLKESIEENVETIKSLESRYDELKTHAVSQLKKANLELLGLQKQHEAETVKLYALVRKAELKSSSLTELIEQKAKENRELAQILDEVIAKVGYENAE